MNTPNQQIDPRFAAAHYGHDLFITDQKPRLTSGFGYQFYGQVSAFHSTSLREAFEAYMNTNSSPYWKTEDHAQEAWNIWCAAILAKERVEPTVPATMYLALTDAMGYDAGEQLLSPEEFATNLANSNSKCKTGCVC